MKKNILFVVDEQKYGGTSVALTNILKQLNIDNYNIDLLILHNRGEALESAKLNKNIHLLYGTTYFSAIDLTISQVLKTKNISLIFHKLQVVFGLKSGSIIKRIVKERKKILNKKYDVEIAFKDGFCHLFTASGDSKLKVAWLHTSYDVNDYTQKYRNLFTKVYNKINKIIAITQDVSDTFNEIYKQNEKSEVIGNLVDVDGIIKKSKEIKFDFPKDKLNLICVGRLSAAKAYPRLLGQITKLKDEGYFKNTILHIIGDGEEETIIRKIIRDNSLEECIDMLGYKNNPFPYIASSDMLLLPSLYEGLGLVLVEANILGVPCFATEISNIYETLNNNQYGLIVKNDDISIYEGLKKILINPQEIIGKYRKNLEKYTYTKNSKIMQKIYEVLNEE